MWLVAQLHVIFLFLFFSFIIIIIIIICSFVCTFVYDLIINI